MSEHISKFRDDKDRIWCVCYIRTPTQDDSPSISVEWIEVRFKNGYEMRVSQEVAERYINLEELG